MALTPIVPNTKTYRYRRRGEALRQEFETYKGQMTDLVDYLLPTSGRFLKEQGTQQDNDGRKKFDKIINTTPADSLRTCAAGLHGGLTSSSEEWFDLKLTDKAWMDVPTIREWLDEVKQRMLMVFARSNFYGAMHSLYYELAAFGTAVMLIDSDMETVVRFRPLTIGEYTLALDSRYRPCALYYRFSMTAQQMSEKFEEKNLPNEVKEAIRNLQYDVRFQIERAIELNADYKESEKLTPKGKKWKSCYYCLDCGDPDTFLEEGGYNSQPFVAFRWDVHGVDTYGTSPGMMVLGDVKQLQRMEIDKLDALAKMVKPPMNAPMSMQNTGGNILPGGVNFIDSQTGAQGFTPAFQVKPDVISLSQEMDRIQKRIENAFFNDLFLSLMNETKRMTAKEVAERSQEKLMVLGPVLERIQAEGLDVLIDRVFAVMLDADLVPPPPQELPPGTPLLVDYISKLAQAQRIVGLTAIEQFTNYVLMTAQGNPAVMDKVDFDVGVEQYGLRLSIPPNMIRSNDDAASIRQQREQQQQKMMLAEQAPKMAQTAQTMSQTPMGDGTAMDAALNAVQGQLAPPG